MFWIEKENNIKIMLEGSFVLIGFIIIIVSLLYPFAFGKGPFYISQLADIGIKIRIGYVLFTIFILYLISIILGLHILHRGPRATSFSKQVFTSIWTTATIILSLTLTHFMFII